MPSQSKKNQFDVLGAVQDGYRVVWQERAYLLRIALIPLLLDISTIMVLQDWYLNAPLIQAFLWELPALTAKCWYMCLIARLIFLGEKLYDLPENLQAWRIRHLNIHAGILFLLLFNFALTAVAAYMQWAIASGLYPSYGPVYVSILFIFGFMVWGVRFGVLHIVAATGHALMPFFKRIEGLMFSFRLIGLGLIASIPVFSLILYVQIYSVPPDSTELPDHFWMIVAALKPVNFLMYTLVNSAAACALKTLFVPGAQKS